MPKLSPSDSTKLASPALADWLDGADASECELIVEAAVPRRRVGFKLSTDGRRNVLSRARVDAKSRSEVLEELNTFATDLLDRSPTVLRSAGALAVQVTPSEARELIAHPLVRAVRLNRQLRLSEPR